MGAPLYQLIYVSAARQAFSEEQLKVLLAKARKRNAERRLTGLLLHERGSFLQVLEGEKRDVDLLYASLGKDPRHHRLVRAYEGIIEARRFGEWSMGFAAIPPRDAKLLDGYSDFFFRYRDSGEAPEADVAQRILSAFRDGRWHSFVER